MNATDVTAGKPVEFGGRLVFLVYDSRSGSTLFSRELAANLPQVVASPEFRLNALFALEAGELRSMDARSLVDRLSATRGLANLELPRDELIAALEADAAERTHEQVVRRVLGLYARRQQREDARVFVIKKGTHLRIWRRVRECIPQASFLHIFRDPRAVINSKLKTPRPYYPREKMAWGGALLAAVQWREYSRQMRAAARVSPVHDVVYEALLADAGTVMSGVAEFFGVDYRPDSQTDYVIPSAEKDIHKLVSAGGFDDSRAAAWRSEMRQRDVVVVDCVAGGEMHHRGYAPRAWPLTTRLAALVAGVLGSGVRLLAHYPYKWLVDRRGAAREAQ